MSSTQDIAVVDDGGQVEVDPDLVFTTPKKDHLPNTTAEQRTVPWELDGEIYYLVKPRKWEDTLVMLEETAARRASQADRLFTGREFLQTVLTPQSLARLIARARDDQDDFEWLDLFDLLPKIIRKLAEKDDAAAPVAAPAKPARARARARAATSS